MPRYFVHMAYDGGQFHGWQRQPNSSTVQQSIEESFSMVYRYDVSVLGCGRTDSGVHASSFYFHVDLPSFDNKTLFRINSILPKSIVLIDFYRVPDNAHARFDATRRGYKYFAHGHKSPFLHQYSSRIVELKNISVEQLNTTAHLLTQYKEFLPFCKAHADNKTMKCDLSKCDWTFDESQKQFTLEVYSDRFLRGMIRLIVGTCVLVAKGDMSIDEVRESMENQIRLPKSLSAPPQGLFLHSVEYNYDQTIK